MGPVPLLRAPPFPGSSLSLSGIAPSLAASPNDGVINRLFAAISDARVGGTFWAPPVPIDDPAILVRARSVSEAKGLHAELTEDERATALWLLPERPRGDAERVAPFTPERTVLGETDPWSLLKPGVRLHAHGDDEWVALGVIAGCDIRVLSPGCHGAPTSERQALRHRTAAALMNAVYRDPFTGEDMDVHATIALLAFWRRIFEANRDVVAACGMAWWKRHEIARFLWSPGTRLRFFRSERRAIAHAVSLGGSVAVWPSRISAGMTGGAEARGVHLVRIEDGFVRSVGLGSDMVPPSSITVDRLGIHYDPSRASDLERVLARTDFSEALLDRAQRLRHVILAGRISKYGSEAKPVFPARPSGGRLILVPGQVEDDMSVRLGGAGLSSNLELLRRVRALDPDAEIWFRPHPDVDAGHRKGAVDDEDALKQADRIVRGGSMADLLEQVDAVHVLTSLTGFEALLRGCEVTCHGMPFYAGWGLTRDLSPPPSRRCRTLTLDQLVAGVLILYPRYLDPVTGLPCEPETLVARMIAGEAVNRLTWMTRIRRWQGRFMKGLR